MNYIKTGKVQNTQGLEGKIIIKYDPRVKKAFQEGDHIFIELNRESYIPFFIVEKNFLSAGELLLKLEEVDQPEQAKVLLDKNVFLEAGSVPSVPVEDGHYEDLQGFVVADDIRGRLGRIETIFETPGQWVATVEHKGKEVLIPLISQTVREINRDKKIVHVTLPAGLLDVYLE